MLNASTRFPKGSPWCLPNSSLSLNLIYTYYTQYLSSLHSLHHRLVGTPSLLCALFPCISSISLLSRSALSQQRVNVYMVPCVWRSYPDQQQPVPCPLKGPPAVRCEDICSDETAISRVHALNSEYSVSLEYGLG